MYPTALLVNATSDMHAGPDIEQGNTLRIIYTIHKTHFLICYTATCYDDTDVPLSSTFCPTHSHIKKPCIVTSNIDAYMYHLKTRINVFAMFSYTIDKKCCLAIVMYIAYVVGLYYRTETVILIYSPWAKMVKEKEEKKRSLLPQVFTPEELVFGGCNPSIYLIRNAWKKGPTKAIYPHRGFCLYQEMDLNPARILSTSLSSEIWVKKQTRRNRISFSLRNWFSFKDISVFEIYLQFRE